jgi:4-hydroxybenzoate polyprenyltransferase
MRKFLDKNMPFIAQMITATLTGMTFLVGFSRVTRSFEMSLLYIAVGFSIIMWAMGRVFERGVEGKIESTQPHH